MVNEGPRAKTVAWVAKHMRQNPEISMTELKKLGKKEGHNVYPLIIGLARKELGLSKPKPTRKKKAGRRKKATRRKTATRRTRRAAGSPEEAISAVLGRLRDLERENARLQAALEKIARLAAGS